MEIRVISMASFIEETFNPSLVHSYCSKCDNFNLHFACPPYDFSIPALLSKYRQVLVISHKLEARQDEYFYWRDLVDPLLMSYERKLNGQALLAGSCRNCSFCFDKGAIECSSPELLRFSFESLGFDVASIVDKYFKEKLSFESRSLHLVYGMLLELGADPIVLKELEGELSELSY